ncbi:hypothetical protein [Lacisediminihabitans changchengi]|uniref:Uncharacterized protein n=1 Tax=Lacisediminihabitans changchengi TaxID=2787634 RepID=A0A934SPA0_9MICO|nr:hypothetical protein [Lacisediminihabitans changchengi]MBK4348702.1 hypothetical protein [Lacisediminihabitans changchengi]
MSPVTRSWLAFAAIGAALIHIALSLGAPGPFAVGLVLLALFELLWGVACLSRDRLVLPQAARAVALVPALIWALLLVIGAALGSPDVAAPLAFVPMGTATAFELAIAIVLSVRLRSPRANVDRVNVDRGGARSLLAIVVGALVIAALTAPALAFTQAGVAAPSELQFPGHPDH